MTTLTTTTTTSKITKYEELLFTDKIKISPINDLILNLVGVYLVIVFLLCIIVNTLLLVVFARFKQLRTTLNKLIMILTVFNLFGSIQFPFVIHSHFVHKYNILNISVNYNP